MRHNLIRGIGALAITLSVVGLGACENMKRDDGTGWDNNRNRNTGDYRTNTGDYRTNTGDMRNDRANPGAGNVGGGGAGNFGSGTGGGTGSGSGTGTSGQGTGSGSSGTGTGTGGTMR